MHKGTPSRASESPPSICASLVQADVFAAELFRLASSLEKMYITEKLGIFKIQFINSPRIALLRNRASNNKEREERGGDADPSTRPAEVLSAC